MFVNCNSLTTKNTMNQCFAPICKCRESHLTAHPQSVRSTQIARKMKTIYQIRQQTFFHQFCLKFAKHNLKLPFQNIRQYFFFVNKVFICCPNFVASFKPCKYKRRIFQKFDAEFIHWKKALLASHLSYVLLTRPNHFYKV